MYAYNERSALRELVEPTLRRIADFGIPPSDPARVLLLAIGSMESAWWYRRQLGQGPARGLWQFERDGGVRQVLEHHSTRSQARMICDDQWVKPTPQAVWEELSHNDLLACAFARLLLWTEPQRLSTDLESGWQIYLRTWRPGKPRRHDWPACHLRACAAVSDTRVGKPLALVAIDG